MAALTFFDLIRLFDEWLDKNVDEAYIEQPLAQDWARISKVIEETGEAISELILFTGQNPRKGSDPHALQRCLNELADVACTAFLAIQHFTKDDTYTSILVHERLKNGYERVTNGK